MNKNQKWIRKQAKENKGQALKVHPEYNKTVDVNNRPTPSSFLPRVIPSTSQPRKSSKAKVGRP